MKIKLAATFFLVIFANTIPTSVSAQTTKSPAIALGEGFHKELQKAGQNAMKKKYGDWWEGGNIFMPAAPMGAKCTPYWTCGNKFVVKPKTQ